MSLASDPRKQPRYFDIIRRIENMANPVITSLPVAVIGAGPVGLAAAAELIRRNIPAVLLEAGNAAGTHMRRWGHVQMFSPWRYNIANAARAMLEATGWEAPDPRRIPTGADVVRHYLDPLAALPAIRDVLSLNTRVVAVSRAGLDKLRDAGRSDHPFLLRVLRDGKEEDLLARAVIDCSGTLSQPAPAGAHGVPARGEAAQADRIAYGMPDIRGNRRDHYAGKRVAVLGSGHSATGVVLDLLAVKRDVPETQIFWLSRRSDLRLAYGGGAADALPARGALGTRLKQAVATGDVRAIHPFGVAEIRREGGTLRLVSGDGQVVEADELVVATGYRPDLAMLAELRLDLDPALEAPRLLAPMIDPNLHSCGTVRPHGARELAQPEPGCYLAGMKSYGRAPTFLLATGYEQVRSIVAEIAGDAVAAARVELDLPQTGVCSTDLAPVAVAAASTCCGGPPKADAGACCVRDEEAHANGEAGCGCGSQQTASPVAVKAQAAACCG